jgi:hypothetical protein
MPISSLALVFVAPLLAGRASSPREGGQARPAPQGIAALFPSNVLAYAEADDLGPLIRRGRTDPLAAAVLDSPAAVLLGPLLAADGEEPLRRAAEIFGCAPVPGLGELAAQGAALGFVLERGQPGFVAVFRSVDGGWLTGVVDRSLAAIAAEAGVDADDLLVEQRSDGTRIFALATYSAAQRGALLVSASTQALVEDVLDRAAGLAPSRRDPSRLEAAALARPAKLLAWGWVDLERVRALSVLARLAGEREGDAEQPLEQLEALASNPGAHLLLGPALSHVATADELTLAARAEAGELVLELGARGLELPAGLTPSGAATPLPPAAAVDAECLDLVIHRDLGAFYARRAELFDPEEVPEIAKKTAELALLFGGADLGEELFPKIGPWIHVVARPAAFGSAPVPSVELPAAAVVLELAESERTGPLFLSAFQTAVGIFNADRGQKRQPPLLLAIEREGTVDVSVARPIAAKLGEPGGRDASDNLVLACAQVGDSLVLGTHVSLVRELVRDLQASPAGPRGGAMGGATREHLVLRGPAIATYLEKNHAALVAQNMLEKGHSGEEARGEVDAFIALVASVARLEIGVIQSDPGALIVAARASF